MLSAISKSTTTVFLQGIVFLTVFIALIAIILPLYVSSKDQSKSSVATRMADLGKAFQEYGSDNDGLMPSGTSPYKVAHRVFINGLGWASELYPYVASPQDFDDGLGQTLPDPEQGSIVSYAYNRNAARNNALSQWTEPDRTVVLFQVTGAHAMIDVLGELADVKGAGLSPSGDGTMVLLMDNHSPRFARAGTGPIGGRAPDAVDGTWPSAIEDGGSLYLLGDGHVSWMKPEEVSSGSDALSRGTNQTGNASGRAAGSENRRYLATFSTK